MAALHIALFCLAALGSTWALRRRSASRAQPLKVIVMAGQSNMEGFGIVEKPSRPQGTLRQLAAGGAISEATDGHRGWKTIKDVTIFTVNQNDKTGPLTVGYGVGGDRIGVEFGFGIEVYNHLREKMLIIKANWGGQSLGGEFRPPSAIRKRGNPQGKRLVDDAGVRYQDILSTIRRVTKNISKIVPNYNSHNGYEISAFLWHQGWNDAVDFDHQPLDNPENMANEYEKNLADFIVDMRQSLRKEFDVANDLPFILGSCGHAGSPNNHKNEGKFGGFVEEGLRKIWTAYDRVSRSNIHPEVGRVFNADSVPFARTKDESPGSQGYHWWENAETYYRLGKEMGRLTIQAIGEGPGRPGPAPTPAPPTPTPGGGGGFATCVAECKRKGHCCSDPMSSANTLISCSQACQIRDRGTSRKTCRRHCKEPRSCRRKVAGLTLELCGDCRGDPPNLKCSFGVPNTKACLDGCSHY